MPQLTGRTMTDHIVVFDGNERLVGQTVAVHIEDASAFTLFGAVV
jgi:tRNA-2-methylthio-N6-dimethylallyladenosine synthase